MSCDTQNCVKTGVVSGSGAPVGGWARCLLFLFCASPANAAEPVEARLSQQLGDTVRPFVASYCLECHDATEPEADLNLSGFRSLDEVVGAHARWNVVLERLENKEMPPDEATRQPSHA
jgi:hypothetical protein